MSRVRPENYETPPGIASWANREPNGLTAFDRRILQAARTPADLERIATGKPPRKSIAVSMEILLRNPSSTEPPAAVVPRLAFAGRTTLLAAREKVGKSTLIAGACAAVSRGWVFLGEPALCGSVLLWSLEEHRADTLRNLQAFGADPALVFLNETLPRDPLEELELAAASRSHTLVCVDTLAKLASGVVKDAGQSAQWEPLMDRLTAISRNTGAALIIVAHAGKTSGEAYRDSTAIGAAVDAVVEMKRGAEANVRDFGVQARWPGGRFSIRLCGELGSETRPEYRLESGAGLSQDARIMLHVSSTPGCSKRAAAKAGGGRYEWALAAVDRLLERGALEKRSEPKKDSLFVAGSRSGTSAPVSDSGLVAREPRPEPLSGTELLPGSPPTPPVGGWGEPRPTEGRSQCR